MKDRLENKIDGIMNYIINKPLSKITLDDYTMLSAELRDIRFRETEAANMAKFEQLVSAGIPAFSGVSEKQ